MKRTTSDVSGSKNLLNLFGYTGMATLAAASAGYDVTHVDASKPAMLWARKNAELSDLGHARIRWILDDASKFVARELRRRSMYHGIVMDPPSFGRGPKREIWKAEKKLNELLMECRRLLEDRGEFLLITVYNLDISALSLRNLMKDAFCGFGGDIDVGELALQQDGGEKILPRSLYARWERP
jgi:23S rRNA (cytosine1962-C5)-methyltransferase